MPGRLRWSVCACQRFSIRRRVEAQGTARRRPEEKLIATLPSRQGSVSMHLSRPFAGLMPRSFLSVRLQSPAQHAWQWVEPAPGVWVVRVQHHKVLITARLVASSLSIRERSERWMTDLRLRPSGSIRMRAGVLYRNQKSRSQPKTIETRFRRERWRSWRRSSHRELMQLRFTRIVLTAKGRLLPWPQTSRYLRRWAGRAPHPVSAASQTGARQSGPPSRVERSPPRCSGRHRKRGHCPVKPTVQVREANDALGAQRRLRMAA